MKQGRSNIKHEGTTQNQRTSVALQDNYVKLVDGERFSRLQYLYALSRKIKFYDETHSVNGKWSNLLEMDEMVTLSEARAVDIKSYQDQFAAHRTWAAKSKGHTQLLFLGRAMSVVRDFVQKFSDYRTKIERANIPARASTINKEWEMALLEMHNAENNMEEAIRTFQNAENPDSKALFKKLKTLFRQLTHSVMFLQSQTDKLLDLSFGHDQHLPHLAMLATFSKLMDHADEALNTFPARHKSFYFKDILKFASRKGQPDQTIVNLQLADGVKRLEIPKGTPFLAGQDEAGNDILYRAKGATILNQATVAELKGLFMERSEGKSTETLNIHQFNYPGTQGQEDWPILGAMGSTGQEDARYGFIVESPYLELNEGNRQLEFTISCSSKAYGIDEQLKQELKDRAIEDFGKVTLRELLATHHNRQERGVEVTIGSFFFKNMSLRSDVDDESADFLISDHFFNSIFRINGGDFAAISLKNFLEKAAEEEEVKAKKNLDITLKEFVQLVEKRNRVMHELDHLEKFLQTFGKTDPDSVKRLFKDCLNVFYSTAEGWHQIEPTLISCPQLLEGKESTAYTINVLLVLEDSQPPIEELTVEEGQVRYFKAPAVRFELNPSAFVYPYDFFASINLDKIDCGISVTGLKSLVGYNQLGPIDMATPFYPFGPTPNLDSYLLIGNKELFKKDLDSMQINLDWMDLPKDSGGFRTHYHLYDLGLDNDSFKVKLSVLKSGEWSPLENEQQEFGLFENQLKSNKDHTLSSKSQLRGIKVASFDLPKDFDWDPDYLLFDPGAKRGFLKLQLSAPRVAFGHQYYPNLLSKIALSNAKRLTGLISGIFKKDVSVELPESPYTPKMNRVTIDYESSFSLEFTTNKKAADTHTRFHYLFPFEGYNELPIGGQKTGVAFVPQFRYEGSLFIGIRNLKSFDTLALFFNMKERVTDQVTDTSPRIYLAYLENNVWRRFRSDQILKDSTDRLLHSGIIKLDLGNFDTSGNTILDRNLFWIRLGALEHTNVLGMVTEISTQAIELEFDQNSEGLRRLNEALPPGSIDSSKDELIGVESIKQALESYGGQSEEKESSVSRRIAERLRHKFRCVDIYGFERIILDRFPAINKVLCLSATDLEKRGLSNGQVIVVVIPRINNRATLFLETPTVSISELRSIRAFLNRVTSPFVKVKVINPLYEKLRVFANVQFKRGLDVGFYLQQLNKDIKSFISPWLKGTEEAPSFQRKIPITEVESFIQGRDYVEFVTKVSLLKVNQNLDSGEEELLSPFDGRDYLTDTLIFNMVHPQDRSLQFVVHVKLGKQEDVSECIRAATRDLRALIRGGQFSDEDWLDQIESLLHQKDYVEFVVHSSVIEARSVKHRADIWVDRAEDEEWMPYEILDTGEPIGEMAIEDEESGEMIEDIQGKYPWSLLTTADNHLITAISSDKYEAPDQAGIEELYLDEDFVIRND